MPRQSPLDRYPAIERKGVVFRLKIGLVLAGVMVVMAASAAPALALFEAETGKLQGEVAKSEILKGGEFVYEPGSGIVKCPTTSPQIKWDVQSKRTNSQQYKIVWGSECTSEIGGNKFPATISESDLLVMSEESGKDAYAGLKGSNLVATEIKTGPCTIIVPAQSNLTSTAQESPSLTSFEETVKVNVTNIAAEKPKNVNCPLVLKSTTAELKGVEFKLKGQGQR
jgi:hypothetical protein